MPTTGTKTKPHDYHAHNESSKSYVLEAGIQDNFLEQAFVRMELTRDAQGMKKCPGAVRACTCSEALLARAFWIASACTGQAKTTALSVNISQVQGKERREPPFLLLVLAFPSALFLSLLVLAKAPILPEIYWQFGAWSRQVS